MTHLKKNLLAVAIMLLMAVSVSAFISAPENTTMYWYNVSDDGQTVSTYIGTTAPSCNEPSGDYCALGFEAEDIQNPGSSSPVLKTDVQNDPLAYNDGERHKL